MPYSSGGWSWSALGPGVESVTLSSENTFRHLFRYVLNDKLTISIDQLTNSLIATGTKTIELQSIVPPIATFVELAERH